MSDFYNITETYNMKKILYLLLKRTLVERPYITWFRHSNVFWGGQCGVMREALDMEPVDLLLASALPLSS